MRATREIPPLRAHTKHANVGTGMPIDFDGCEFEECPTCGGDGFLAPHMACPDCHGDGEVTVETSRSAR